MPEETTSDSGQDPGPIETGPVENITVYDPGPIEVGAVMPAGPDPMAGHDLHLGEAGGHEARGGD